MVGKRFDVGREGELGEGEDEGGRIAVWLTAALGLTLGDDGEFSFFPTLSPPFFFLSFLNGCCLSGLHVRDTSHPTTNTHIQISFSLLYQLSRLRAKTPPT
jgi:hypothetical protein